jgi:hypothetical protein
MKKFIVGLLLIVNVSNVSFVFANKNINMIDTDDTDTCHKLTSKEEQEYCYTINKFVSSLIQFAKNKLHDDHEFEQALQAINNSTATKETLSIVFDRIQIILPDYMRLLMYCELLSNCYKLLNPYGDIKLSKQLQSTHHTYLTTVLPSSYEGSLEAKKDLSNVLCVAHKKTIKDYLEKYWYIKIPVILLFSTGTIYTMYHMTKWLVTMLLSFKFNDLDEASRFAMYEYLLQNDFLM